MLTVMASLLVRTAVATVVVIVAPTPVQAQTHTPPIPATPAALDPSAFGQAQVLEEGEGVDELEQLHASYALDLSIEDAQAGREAVIRLLVHGQTETARQLAIDGLVSTGTVDWPSDYRGDFLRELAPSAIETAMAYGVPASITMAQAIQESGWGRSGLARRYNNLFGVKAGRAKNAVEMKTDEFTDGKMHSIRARFRTFTTPSEAVQHHGALLSADRRYAHAYENNSSWQTFLSYMAPVYASDPKYAQRVTWLIERYELDRWDPLVNEVAAHKPSGSWLRLLAR